MKGDHLVDVGENSNAGGIIHNDVSCVACGYNLRGLACTNDCPECGCAIAQSLQPHPLTDAGTRRRVRAGIALLAIAVITEVLVYSEILIQPWSIRRLLWPGTLDRAVLVATLAVLFAYAGARGAWLASIPLPHPTGYPQRSTNILRRVLRCIAVLAAVANAAVVVGADWSSVASYFGIGWPRYLHRLALVVVIVPLKPAMLCIVMLYLSRITRPFCSGGLRQFDQLVRWTWLAISMAFLLLCGGALLPFFRQFPRLVAEVVLFLTNWGALGPVVLLAMYFYCLRSAKISIRS